MRTLWLSGRARRFHQCLQCRHRHEDETSAWIAPAPRADKFGCLPGLPAVDRDIVEGLILLMLGTGSLLGAVELTATGITELEIERGPPSTVLRGFAFPVFSWLVDEAGRYASHFVAIDQGAMRVCFKVRRRRLASPW